MKEVQIMVRYLNYYDGYGRFFCRMDAESGEVFDEDGTPLPRLPDFVYEEWERGGGRIKEDCVFESEPTEVPIPSVDDENDDDDWGSTPPPWLDEFEYIDWVMTH